MTKQQHDLFMEILYVLQDLAYAINSLGADLNPGSCAGGDADKALEKTRELIESLKQSQS